MQYLRFILTCLAIAVYSPAAELSPEAIEDLQDEYKGRMKIWAVQDDDYEDKHGREYFVLEFESRQDIRDNDLNYELHVTVQLTDKKTKTMGYAEVITSPGPIRDPDFYADHTAWEFRIPFNDMKKPKMTACVIEFGFIKQGQFIPIAVECDKVDSPKEIIAAGGQKLEMKTRGGMHYYWSY